MANSRRKEDGEIGKYDKTKSLFFQHTRNHRGCDVYRIDAESDKCEVMSGNRKS